MIRKVSILFFIALIGCLKSQIPDTDIWLLKLEKTKTEYKLVEATNITNRSGYDNQPVFSSDGKKIYYTSIREDKQADIYYYDLKHKQSVQITHSKESEYSPKQTLNAEVLSSVVVDSDSSQHIEFINELTGKREKKLSPDSVGYYTFLNTDTVLYYKLTNPNSLRFLSIKTGSDHWLGNNPTHSFPAINRHAVIYGLKDSLQITFYIYDFLTRKAEKYTHFNSLNEDFIWHPQFGLVKSEMSKLLYYNDVKKEWLLLFDVSVFGVKKITRFNFDQKTKYLVIVS